MQMPIQWTTSSFLHHSLAQVTEILNKSFEDYVIQIDFKPEIMARMMRNQGVDLLESRLLLADGEEAGAAMMSIKGTLSRVASLGVYKKYRRQGGARFLMNQVISEARDRQDTEMELEAIEGNDKAIALYQDLGFRKIRHLSGYIGRDLQGVECSGMKQISIQEAAKRITIGSVDNAPAMLTGEAVAYCRQPSVAYQLGDAVAIVMPQGEDVMEIFGLVLTSDTEVQRDTIALLLGLQKRYPERRWHVGPFFPDELVTPIMTEAGLKVMDIAQGQYRLSLAQMEGRA